MPALKARATYGGLGACPPQEIFKIEHSETLFPAFLETKNQFLRQGWSSLKFSLKSKKFNENGQLIGEGAGGNGNNRIFSCLSFCYSLVSKFMRCFSKKIYNNKKMKKTLISHTKLTDL